MPTSKNAQDSQVSDAKLASNAREIVANFRKAAGPTLQLSTDELQALRSFLLCGDTLEAFHQHVADTCQSKGTLGRLYRKILDEAQKQGLS